ncbi:MAG: hypothetical protein GY943_30600 [Chloroflexi bacterium]|nr:hypothetical protein [Chloroflexota bacterium]
MTSATFQHLERDEVDAEIPGAVKFIHNAIERTGQDLNLSYVMNDCRIGGLHMAVSKANNITVGAIVFRIEDWRGKTVCRVMALGGEGDFDWPAMLDELKVYCKSIMVTKIIFGGRKGWERVIKNARVTSVNYEVDI